LLLFVTLSAVAATFERRYGTEADERGVGVAATVDGGFIAVASSVSPDQPGCMLLVRADSVGRAVLERTISFPLQVRIAGMAVISDSSPVVVGGARTGRGDWDCFAARLTATGDTAWTRTWGDASTDDEAVAVARLGSGELAVLGYTLERGQSDFLVACFTPSGMRRWVTAIGSSEPEIPAAIAASVSGGAVAVGSVYPAGSRFSDMQVMWFDVDGRDYRTRAYGDTLWDEARGVAVAPDGDIVVVGTKSSDLGNDASVLRLDTLGQGRWQRTFGFDGSDVAAAVAVTIDGDLLVAGSSSTPGSAAQDLYLIRTDPDGFRRWERLYGASGVDWGTAIATSAVDAGVLVAGASDRGDSSGYDLYVLKTDSAGGVDVRSDRSRSPARSSATPCPAAGGLWLDLGNGSQREAVVRTPDGRNVCRINHSGRGRFWWHAVDDRGQRLPAGVYFVEAPGLRVRFVIAGGR
jgi:hypothetical protein